MSIGQFVDFDTVRFLLIPTFALQRERRAMMQTIEKIMGLESLGNVVPEGYQYYPKLVTPREDLSLPSAYLK